MYHTDIDLLTQHAVFPKIWNYSFKSHVKVLLPCLKQGNSMAIVSGWPSSLTITLSRNQPQPPPRPSWPTRTLRTWPKDTDSMRNSSCWREDREKKDVCSTFPRLYVFILCVLMMHLHCPFQICWHCFCSWTWVSPRCHQGRRSRWGRRWRRCHCRWRCQCRW